MLSRNKKKQASDHCALIQQADRQIAIGQLTRPDLSLALGRHTQGHLPFRVLVDADHILIEQDLLGGIADVAQIVCQSKQGPQSSRQQLETGICLLRTAHDERSGEQGPHPKLRAALLVADAGQPAELVLSDQQHVPALPNDAP